MIFKHSQPLILLFFTLICFVPSTLSQSSMTGETGKTLRVGVAGGEPFVFENTD